MVYNKIRFGGYSMGLNIYDFINNEDLVEKCKELNWNFSDYEKAKIILTSFNSLDMKKNAYQQLLSETTDEKLKFEITKIVEFQDKAQEDIKLGKRNTTFLLYIRGLDVLVFDHFEDAYQYALDYLKDKKRNFKIKKARKNLKAGKLYFDDDYVIYNNEGVALDFSYYTNDEYIKSFEIDSKTFSGFDEYVPFWDGYVKYPEVYDDYTVLRRRVIDPELRDDTQYIACNNVAFNGNNEAGIVKQEKMPYDIFAGQLCYKYIKISKRKHSLEVETIPFEGLRKVRKEDVTLNTKDTIKHVKDLVEKLNSK